MRLGIAAYIVPFIFALHPPLIFIGSPTEIIVAIVTAVIGVILLATGCAGYLFRPLNWPKRGLFWLASLLLLIPNWSGVWLAADAAGFLLGIGLVAWEWSFVSLTPRRRRESRKALPIKCPPRSLPPLALELIPRLTGIDSPFSNCKLEQTALDSK